MHEEEGQPWVGQPWGQAWVSELQKSTLSQENIYSKTITWGVIFENQCILSGIRSLPYVVKSLISVYKDWSEKNWVYLQCRIGSICRLSKWNQ